MLPEMSMALACCINQQIMNYERFTDALNHRPKDVGLITIANHVR